MKPIGFFKFRLHGSGPAPQARVIQQDDSIMTSRTWPTLRALAIAATLCLLLDAVAHAQSAKKPNILVIWGDDIGQFNVSAYNTGMMGYRTPNIDRIAREGAMFTDWYGQQSCTAGRAAFITGQSPMRTGLTKVGLPGAPEGMKKEDPTIAGLLKAHGYMTGQFGKNHLGDRDEMLPTNHGFDEFFGNLYHLNAEQEPEHPDYPKDPEFKKKFGPRGVIKSLPTAKIEDTGPLTKKRMETVDEEVTTRALDFMDRAHKADKPFFVWWNSTRMHIWTHLKEGVRRARPDLAFTPTAWSNTTPWSASCSTSSMNWASTDNTIVMYSTDNGAEVFHLARRRHDHVPRREGHAVGRRLPRPDRDSLARRHQARHDHQRHLCPRRHAADAARRCR